MYTQLLGYNSELEPYLTPYFPYSYGKFVDMRYWVESHEKYGQRVGTRAWNPYDKRLAAPKASPFHDVAFLFQFEGNPLPQIQLINFDMLTDQQLLDICTFYVFDDFQKQKLRSYIDSLVQPVHLPMWAQEPMKLGQLVLYDPSARSGRTYDESKLPHAGEPVKRGRGRPPKQKQSETSHSVQARPMVPEIEAYTAQVIIDDNMVMSNLLTIKDEELPETALVKARAIISEVDQRRMTHGRNNYSIFMPKENAVANDLMRQKLASHNLTVEAWYKMEVDAANKFAVTIQEGIDKRAKLLKQLESVIED